MQILEAERFVLQPNLSQGGDHALLDFGSGPSLGNSLQPVKLQFFRIDSAFLQVNPKHLDPFLFGGEIDEEDFIEAAFADHLCRKQIDAIGGGRDKKASRLFLHPGQEESENASEIGSAFAALRRQSHLDFIKPDDGRRNRLDGAACLDERGIRISMAPGKHFAHFDAVERKPEAGGDCLHRQAFAAARTRP